LEIEMSKTHQPYTKEEKARIKAAYDNAWRKESVWDDRKLAGRRAADDKRDEIAFEHQMSFARRNA
jgi:hypothetical protein